MRQKNETAASFNQLKEIMQARQAKKTSGQTSGNAEASEFKSQSAPKPKARARAKNYALNPTKRAFSERQMTTIRDNSQAAKQANQQGDNANAFKSDEKNTRGQK
ncbi:hypothetical protein [Helicobacter pylori]|uniref:hypothetical protein n=1 Tax=Helicobacter pylori TaxID=210 RepID=UPI0036F1CEF3